METPGSIFTLSPILARAITAASWMATPFPARDPVCIPVLLILQSSPMTARSCTRDESMLVRSPIRTCSEMTVSSPMPASPVILESPPTVTW